MAKKYLSTLKVSAGLFSAILIVLLASGLLANAQTVSTETKDQGLQMSLLISSPSTEAVYTRYGHVAFRILNPVQGTDIAYNYGMFDYNEPNFILRFVRGETDYYVEALYTSYYVEEYLRSGRGIVELVLNLTQEEIEKAERYLAWNIRPENKRYRYNIFYDNCATRLIEIIKETTGATLQIPHEGEERKWRQLIDECCTDAPWVKFGINLALGRKQIPMPIRRSSYSCRIECWICYHVPLYSIPMVNQHHSSGIPKSGFRLSRPVWNLRRRAGLHLY